MTKYGFGGRLKEEFPSQIIVDVTEVCNLACTHCPHSDFVKSPNYGARMLDPQLNKKMVNEVREHGADYTQYIRYSSSGEALIHPNIIDIIGYAVRYSNTFVTLTTNGTLMNSRISESLINVGLDAIDISVDALTSETYSKIRVNGNYNKTVSNVINFIKLREQAPKKTKVVVSFVEQPQNSHEAAGFKRFWKDMGADYVVIRRLHSAAGAKPIIAQEMKSCTKERKPCIYPWERIVLNAKGFLAFCPAAWQEGSDIVDYHKTTIAETWKNLYYINLRNAHLINDFTGFDFCGQCPDWQQVRWPEEGRSYADMIGEFSKDE